MAFNAKLNLGVEWRQEKSQDLTTPYESIVTDFSVLFEEGTGGAGYANAVYCGRMNAGTVYDLNTLTDPLGRSLNFTKLKAVIFKCVSITVPGNNLIVYFTEGLTGSNAAFEMRAVGEVGAWLYSTGHAATGDAVVSATCTGGGTYDLYIIGTK